MTITITDQNGATTLAGVNYNGRQKVVVHYDEGGSDGFKYDHTFAESEWSASTVTTSNATGSRSIGVSNWKTPTVAGQESHEYLIYRLQEAANGPTEYVQLAEWRNSVAGSIPNRVAGFHLVGTATDAAAMPKTGSAVFNGMAAGKYFATNTGPGYLGVDFTSLVTLTANFQTSRADTRFSQFAYASGSGPAFDFTTSGSISGSNFTGTGVIPTFGVANVAGQFYGPGTDPASEAGGVISAVSGTRALMGGFVAGR